MRRILLSIVLGAFVYAGSNAQQDPRFSQFMFTQMTVNPGATGISGNYCGTFLYRNQWLGFDGSPSTALVQLEAPIDVISSGAGLTFYYDQLGFETNLVIRGQYAYHLTLGVGKLGMGLGLGFAQKSFDADWNPIDPVSVDRYIPGAQESQGSFDMSLGFFYEQREFFAGISSTHLTGQALDKVNMDVARHYWITGGYNFYNVVANLDLTPSILAKSDIAETQLDFNVMAKYHMGNNTLFGGVSYRFKDAVAPMLGYTVKMPGGETSGDKFLSFGVAYDVTTSPLRTYNSGTIEFFAKFCFKPLSVPPTVIIRDVRYL